MRPRRAVQWSDGHGWVVDSSTFHTTDRDLATAVRDRLDRIDPLPCDHDDTVEIRRLCDPHPELRCTGCGAHLEENDQ